MSVLEAAKWVIEARNQYKTATEEDKDACLSIYMTAMTELERAVGRES